MVIVASNPKNCTTKHTWLRVYVFLTRNFISWPSVHWRVHILTLVDVVKANVSSDCMSSSTCSCNVALLCSSVWWLTKIFDVKDEEDGFMLTDTAIKNEEMMEVNAGAEFGGDCTRKKHKHRSWLARSGSNELEAEDTQAIQGDVLIEIAWDSLDPRGRPSTVDRLYKGKLKLSERRTAGEQQLNRTRSSNCGCEEARLQVVTPRSFLTTQSDNKTKHLLSESRMVRVSKSWYIFGWIFARLSSLCFEKTKVDWGKAFTVVALMTGFSKKIGFYLIPWEPLYCMRHPEKHGFRAIHRKG